jgi:hypothetical protein
MFVPGEKQETHMSIVDAPRVWPELEIVHLEEVAAEKLYEFVFFGPLYGRKALSARRCHRALIQVW